MSLGTCFSKSLVRRHLLVVIPLLAVISPAQQKSTSTVPEQGTFQRRYEIHESLLKNKLSQSDLHFLLNEVETSTVNHGQPAIALLAEAANRKLYPEQDVKDIIERKAKVGGIWWTVAPALDYYILIRPGKHFASQALSKKYGALTAKKKSLNRIDQEEKTFILNTLKLPSDDDRVRAACVALQKSKLDRTSLRWLQSLISQQIRSHSEPVRAYWEFISRIVSYRSQDR